MLQKRHIYNIIFQSTLPQGERRLPKASGTLHTWEFQSTLPQGERLDRKDVNGNYCPISIHAPTRGATRSLYRSIKCKQISIHAPTRGATRHTADRANSLYFNPRSHKGSDVAAAEGMAETGISIHAPTRGATAILHKIPYLFYFIFTNPFPISYFHTQPASDF